MAALVRVQLDEHLVTYVVVVAVTHHLLEVCLHLVSGDVPIVVAIHLPGRVVFISRLVAGCHADLRAASCNSTQLYIIVFLCPALDTGKQYI
eukprot:SAG31_NODE_18468_length_635_cov_0.966418_1_plen_92_part_00